MAQTARRFASYAAGMQAFIEEEFIGEALFAALADQHDGEARQAFLLMSKIERAVIIATEAVVARNCLDLRTPESLHAEGRAEAETMRDMSWQDFVDQCVTDYPAFLDEFEQVAQLAPPEDAADAKLLIDHEVAFIDFAVAHQRGDRDSIGILERFLARIPIETPPAPPS